MGRLRKLKVNLHCAIYYLFYMYGLNAISQKIVFICSIKTELNNTWNKIDVPWLKSYNRI